MNIEEARTILNKYSNPTRRQHYVKREYLSNWSKDKKSLLMVVKNSGKSQRVTLKDACIKKDFYRVYHHFNNIEEQLLLNLCQDNDPFIKRACIDELSKWQSETHKIALLRKTLPNEYQLLNNFEIQSGEDYQTVYEEQFYEIIKKYVMNFDDSFLDNTSLKAAFCMGLAVQYLRTAGMNNAFASGFDKLKQDSIIKEVSTNAEQFSLMASRIMAIKMAFVLMHNHNSGIEWLKTNKTFITSDMPLVHIGQKDEKGYAKDMVIYFPLNPRIAIIYPSKNKGVREIKSRELSYFNDLMKINADKFLFGCEG